MTHRLPLFLAVAFAFTPLIALADTPAAAPAPAPVVAPAATTPTPATEAPAAPVERPSSYTVAQGDSLWTIAHKFGSTVVELRKANNLKKGALLHPGQQLVIPPAANPAK